MLSWMLEENIVNFVKIVSERVGYNADEWDTDAVKFGLENTKESENQWFQYPLIGQITLELSYASGSNNIIHVRGDVPAQIIPNIQAVLVILQVHCAEGETDDVEGLVVDAFKSSVRPKWLLGCSPAECRRSYFEYSKILKAFSDMEWRDLTRENNRPPLNSDLYLLNEQSLQYFYPAYLIASLRDWNAIWVEQIQRMEHEGWVSLPASATPLQRELQLFVLRVLGARPDAPAAF